MRCQLNLAQCNRAKGTIKQRAFVRYLFDINNPQTFGNGTQSARKAHYKGSDGTLANIAWENVRKPQVVKMAEDIIQNILSTDEVEREITKVAQTNTPIDGTMKMKALDLLTKIKAMQVQKLETTQKTEQSAVIEQTILKRADRTGEDVDEIALSLIPQFEGEPEFLDPVLWGRFAHHLSDKPQETKGLM